MRACLSLLVWSALLASCGPAAKNEKTDTSQASAGGGGDMKTSQSGAVSAAKATAIPSCTVFVDAAAPAAGSGSVTHPYNTIGIAVRDAANGAVICVAEGTYSEQLAPGEKYFSLVGGFQARKEFKVRDSSLYVSKAQGSGGSFLRYDDPAPKGTELTAVDGFEITGYSQAVVRDYWEAGRFDLTNNFIHDNVCASDGLAGGGFSLSNVSGTISGNVIKKNRCGRGGGGFLGDSTNTSVIAVSNNLVEENAGDEPQASHGGAFYFFGHTLTITGNTFIKNTVTGWGAGLYLGAYSPGGQETSATLTWNVYRDNRADNTGGGMFCDDSAHCTSDHEIYDRNCGGNIYLDSGPDDAAPTVASFDHVTNYGALDATCAAPGPGVVIDEGNAAQDVYTFKNAIFWGNAAGRDFSTSCVAYCSTVNASITSSSVQQSYHNDGVNVTFGAGVVEASDPRFVDAAAHDFRLQAKDGVWAKLGAYGE